MNKNCQWLVDKLNGKVVHNCGPEDYIHPEIVDVVDHMVGDDRVLVMINLINWQTFGH